MSFYRNKNLDIYHRPTLATLPPTASHTFEACGYQDVLYINPFGHVCTTNNTPIAALIKKSSIDLNRTNTLLTGTNMSAEWHNPSDISKETELPIDTSIPRLSQRRGDIINNNIEDYQIAIVQTRVHFKPRISPVQYGIVNQHSDVLINGQPTSIINILVAMPTSNDNYDNLLKFEQSQELFLNAKIIIWPSLIIAGLVDPNIIKPTYKDAIRNVYGIPIIPPTIHNATNLTADTDNTITQYTVSEFRKSIIKNYNIDEDHIFNILIILYTYPSESADTNARRYSCSYTSYNCNTANAKPPIYLILYVYKSASLQMVFSPEVMINPSDRAVYTGILPDILNTTTRVDTSQSPNVKFDTATTELTFTLSRDELIEWFEKYEEYRRIDDSSYISPLDDNSPIIFVEANSYFPNHPLQPDTFAAFIERNYNINGLHAVPSFIVQFKEKS